MTDSDNVSPDDPHDAGRARIAKVMARAGLASRRDAEAWIEAGRVSVNGKTVLSPALNVGPHDKIAVDGKPMPTRERTRLWLYHKPRGLVTTAKDPEGRTTVFEVLPPELPRVVSVGRLDLNTEGLLLLTNDGGLARVLAHPSTAWLRRYRVRAFGKVDLMKLQALRGGIEIDGFSYGPIEAELDRQQGDNSWLTLGLREGKNREVRKVLEHLGLSVNRLIRISFGPFQLGDLGEGAAEEIRTRYLKDQLGGLAEEAECDFDAPIVERQPETVKRALRARAESAEAPRRRAGLTTDRKGRRVLVERVEKGPAKEAKARPDRDTRNPRGPRDEAPQPMRGQKGDRVERKPRREGDAPARPFRAREDRPDRPLRDERRGPPRDHSARPPRRDGEAPRPFRAREDRPDRPPRRDGGAPRPFGARDDRPTRPPRREGDGSRPLRAREDRPREERTERPQEPRPNGNRTRVFRARPPREERPEREERRGPPRDRDQRPPRGDGPRPPRRDENAPRPPRRDGDKPRGFAGRPGAGKPGGREDRPHRDETGPRPPRRDGDKPRGFGGKPAGAGGDRPRGFGGKPGGRPSGPGRPGGRPSGPPRGGKPGGKPGGRPGGGKPRSRG
jgi:23S rRNA pseudouridine2605 synthase